jgi:hypothetical protein
VLFTPAELGASASASWERFLMFTYRRFAMTANALLALFAKAAADLKAMPDGWRKDEMVKKATGAYAGKLTAAGLDHVAALVALHKVWMTV